jgi:hypothetical protein
MFKLPEQVCLGVSAGNRGILGYEASQVTEAYKQGLEDAAALCEVEAEDADVTKRKPLLTPTGTALYEGMWGGATNCAAAIRALKGSEQ